MLMVYKNMMAEGAKPLYGGLRHTIEEILEADIDFVLSG